MGVYKELEKNYGDGMAECAWLCFFVSGVMIYIGFFTTPTNLVDSSWNIIQTMARNMAPVFVIMDIILIFMLFKIGLPFQKNRGIKSKGVRRW